MAHKIEKNDRVYLARTPELFDGKGWHGLGIPTDSFDKGNLNGIFFPFEFRPAYVKGLNDELIQTGERYAVALDNGEPIAGAVGRVFDTVNNEELFDLFLEALSGSRYSVCSAMTLGNRKSFVVDAKAGETIKAAGRDILPYVGLSRGFGGSEPLRISAHNTVIQCANTLALFNREADMAGDSIRHKNTSRLRERLPMIQAMIERSWGVQAEFAKALEDAQSHKIKPEQARLGFVGLLGVDNLGKTARTANRVNRLVQLFKGGAGNKGEDGSDWVNAVTDYYTHESAGSLDSSDSREEFMNKQWASSEFGSASRIKTELANTLLTGGRFVEKEFKAMVSRGRKAIENSDKEVVALLEA